LYRYITVVYIYLNSSALPKRLLSKCEFYETGNNPPLRLHTTWQDIILEPAILDLFFTLYWKVRSNPQLAHHAMTCLIQLASLHGKILNTEQVKMQYLTNYMQRFLKLISNIEINDQEANGISNIIRKINNFFQSSLKSLSEDLYKSFMEQIIRLTCLFIECAAQEESVIIIVFYLHLNFDLKDCFRIRLFFLQIFLKYSKTLKKYLLFMKLYTTKKY